MARIANKYLPIHQIDPKDPHLFLAHLIGAKDFRRDILLRIITDENEWLESLAMAKKCAHLHHSNVLQILDVGQHNDFWYIAYEFVEALTILEIVQKKSPINLEHIIYITTEILKALNYAIQQHTEPIHHNNLTPDQILITKQGTIKIKGFAMQCSLASDSNYRHPNPQHRCAQDIFSIGTILYQLCMLLQNPPKDLIRIAQQARSQDIKIQFQNINAMYDILIRRFPLSGTTSVDLAQRIIITSFSQWEEQPTFVSKTLTTKDTQIFVKDHLIKDVPVQIEAEKKTPPEPLKITNKWIFFAAIFVFFSLFIGIIVGQQFSPPPSFKLMLPPQFSLQANGEPFTKISNLPLDNPIELNILHNEQSVLQTDISIVKNQNLIILLPVETTCPEPCP